MRWVVVDVNNSVEERHGQSDYLCETLEVESTVSY